MPWCSWLACPMHDKLTVFLAAGERGFCTMHDKLTVLLAADERGFCRIPSNLSKPRLDLSQPRQLIGMPWSAPLSPAALPTMEARSRVQARNARRERQELQQGVQCEAWGDRVQGWVWLLERNREMAHHRQAGLPRGRRSPLHVIFPSAHEIAKPAFHAMIHCVHLYPWGDMYIRMIWLIRMMEVPLRKISPCSKVIPATPAMHDNLGSLCADAANRHAMGGWC